MTFRNKPKINLREVLFNSGLVSQEKLNEIDDKLDGTKLGQLLLEQQIITAKELAMIVGLQFNIPCVNLNTFQIQPEALQLVPELMARRYSVIPLQITNDALQVATAEPDNVILLETLAAKAKMRVEPLVAPLDEIHEAIDRNYKSFSEIEQQLTNLTNTVTQSETLSAETVEGAPVVRALNLLINEAIKNRASDIHLEPEEKRLRVRYRIDGVLHETMSLPSSAHPPLISRLKIMANMNIADHRPQDGQFSVKIRDREIDIRVATIYTTYGEMGILRILDKSFSALALNQLGFIPEQLPQYEKILRSPYGMILICGPTGSGKTTTLYASINNLDCKARKIITIEDPVEYRFQGINQIQVNTRGGITFANGLRAIMRCDPNVILVGEIRDTETAQIATQAALTGHMVLSSVHANNSVGAIFRLIDLGVGPFLITSAVICIVAQRMVRRVCPNCKQSIIAPLEAQAAYNTELGEQREKFSYGTGCNICSNTGYFGRSAVFEIMTLSEELKRLILSGSSTAQLWAQTQKEGMISMWRSGMLKVKAGTSTPEEILRNVFSIG